MDITGSKISTVARTYQPFTDRETGETRPGGETHWLWLSPGANQEPVKIRVKDPALFGALDQEPVGSVLVVTVSQVARGSVITNVAEAVINLDDVAA